MLKQLIERLTAQELRKLERRINRTLRRWERVNAGDPFGCDWPTFGVNYPGTYRVFRIANAEYRRRGGYRMPR